MRISLRMCFDLTFLLRIRTRSLLGLTSKRRVPWSVFVRVKGPRASYIWIACAMATRVAFVRCRSSITWIPNLIG